MIEKVKFFLESPFPYSDSGFQGRLLIVVGSGAFVSLFLIIFQPFGSYEWQNPDKNLLLAGFGLITSFCLSISLFLLPKVFVEYFTEEVWTTRREITHSVSTILLISIGNYLYSSIGLNSDFRFSLNHFLFMIWATFLIGLFPSSFLTFYRFQRNQK